MEFLEGCVEHVAFPFAVGVLGEAKHAFACAGGGGEAEHGFEPFQVVALVGGGAGDGGGELAGCGEGEVGELKGSGILVEKRGYVFEGVEGA